MCSRHWVLKSWLIPENRTYWNRIVEIYSLTNAQRGLNIPCFPCLKEQIPTCLAEKMCSILYLSGFLYQSSWKHPQNELLTVLKTIPHKRAVLKVITWLSQWAKMTVVTNVQSRVLVPFLLMRHNIVSCTLDNIELYLNEMQNSLKQNTHRCWFRGACWLLPNTYNIFLPESVFNCIQVMTFDYSAKCH